MGAEACHDSAKNREPSHLSIKSSPGLHLPSSSTSIIFRTPHLKGDLKGNLMGANENSLRHFKSLRWILPSPHPHTNCNDIQQVTNNKLHSKTF